MSLPEDQKAYARERLRETEDALGAATSGLSTAQWRYDPGAGRWSIAAVVEHCAIVHERVLGLVTEHLRGAPLGANPDAAAVDELLTRRVADRSMKLQAPEFVHPGNNEEPNVSLARVSAANEHFLEQLETATHLRDRCIPGPPARALSDGRYELMDGYQWIIAAAGHIERHTDQILEIRSSAGFPAA